MQNGVFYATITFTEAVSDFVQSDVAISGTASASITAWNTTDNIVYTGTITPTSSGTVILNVAANVATDAASKKNTAATAQTVNVDMDAPGVTVSVPSDDQTNAFDATITFTEAVSGFEQDDLTISGTATATVTAWNTVDNITYSATVTASLGGQVSLSVAAGVATDAANNSNTASTTQTVTILVSQPQILDTVAPEVSINVPSGVQNGAFDVTITFSETVSGFAQADVVLTGSAASITAWSANTDNTVYTATITPTASGTVTVDVAANVATDAANNPNTAAAQSVTVSVDTTAPSVSISVPSIVQNSAFNATITFSEAVSGFVQADVTLSGSTASITAWSANSDNTVYTATITPTASGTVTVGVAADVATDAAKNGNTGATSQTVSVDVDAPSVSVSVPSGDQSNAFDATITFTEAVSGFTQSDISVAGTASATVTELSTTDNTTYTATITASVSGSVSVSVPANAATDRASNPNTASTTQTVTVFVTQPQVVDLDPPAVSIAVPGGVQNGAFDVTITFTEAVSDFEQADVSLTGTATASITAWSASTDNTVYTATITPTTSGEVTVGVAAGVATDAASNPNTAATSQTVTVSFHWMPNANLRAAVREALGLEENEELTQAKMLELTKLKANSRQIENLTGLEFATNLTELQLRKNKVSDLSPIAGLTNIKDLWLDRNEIGDLAPLSNLENLSKLVLYMNSISNLSPLSGLTSLTVLSVGQNRISDVSPVSGLTSLEFLLLSDNSISDLRPVADVVAGLTELVVLSLQDNPFMDTSPLYPHHWKNGGTIKLMMLSKPLYQYAPWDVNEDGSVDATDSALVTAALGQTGDDIVDPRTDVNCDFTVDNADLTLVTDNLDSNTAPPSKSNLLTLLDRATLAKMDPESLTAQLEVLRAESDGSAKFLRAIAFLESVLAEMRPDETRLLANYPNPFNPETWMPYELANDADVQILVYDISGVLVRQLDLGYQRAGYYTERSRAGYWDGRNEHGERVTTGIYFYQLHAGHKSLLRKMLILK